MTAADMLVYCDHLSDRIKAMRADAQAFVSSHPNWITYPDPPECWWPPHPSAAQHRDHLLPAIAGVAVGVMSGAAAIVLALILVNPQ